MVPMTSDLAGYQAFWNWWLNVLVMSGVIGWAVIVLLLALLVIKR